MSKILKVLSLIIIIAVTAMTASCDMFFAAPAGQILSGIPALEKPETPGNVRISHTATNYLDISWEESVNASTYNLSRSTSLYGTYTNIYSGTTPSYRDSGLIDGTTYFYYVSATNSAGTSDASSPISGTTLVAQTAPAVPANLRVTNSTATTLTISWNTSADATTYALSRSVTSNGTYTEVYSGTATTYNDTGLTPETDYYYMVTAANSVGSSSASAAVIGSTTILTAPATPANLTVSNATGSTLDISWDASPDATSYTLQYANSTELPLSYTTIHTGSETSYTHSGLTAGTTYYYIVYASNTAGNSSTTAAAEGTTTAPSIPGTPANLTVSNPTSSTLDISWDASAGATSYSLSRSTASNGTYTTVYTGANTSYSDTGLSENITYYYKVSASNEGGASSESNAVSAATVSTWSKTYSSWSHRKEITITETSGSTLTNYQLLLSVPYDSNMNTDFSDLRFTTDDNETVLNYWIERQTDSVFADVWVKVPSIPASGTSTIIMYFGNASAATAMDGFNTFIFFDDFEDGVVESTKWNTAYYSTTLSESGGTIRAVNSDANNMNAIVSLNSLNFSNKKTALNWYYTSNTDNSWGGIFFPGGALKRDSFATANRWYDLSPGSLQSTYITMTYNTWYRLLLKNNGTDYLIEKDYGAETLSGSNYNYSSTETSGYIGRAPYPGSTGTYVYLDYILIAENAASEPTYTIEGSGVAILPPTTPANLTVTNPTASSLYISWDASAGATSYTLYKATSSNGPYTELITRANTSCLDTGLSKNTTYYYKVVASNSAGSSNMSAVVSGSTDESIFAPTAPANLTVSNPTTSSLDISWDASAGATSYRLYRATSSGGIYTEIYEDVNTSYSDTGLPYDTTYYYKVIASNSSVSSEFSNIVSGTTSPVYTVSLSKTGQGNVTSDFNSYPKNSLATITATPSSGWQFSHWTGNATGSTNPIQITMDANKSVTANFTQITYDPIVVTSPTTTTVWSTGQTKDVSISWDAGNVGGNVKIELLRNGSVYSTITSSTTNDGSYGAYDIPSNLPTGNNDYTVRITSLTDASLTDTSDLFDVKDGIIIDEDFSSSTEWGNAMGSPNYSSSNWLVNTSQGKLNCYPVYTEVGNNSNSWYTRIISSYDSVFDIENRGNANLEIKYNAYFQSQLTFKIRMTINGSSHTVYEQTGVFNPGSLTTAIIDLSSYTTYSGADNCDFQLIFEKSASTYSGGDPFVSIDSLKVFVE